MTGSNPRSPKTLRAGLVLVDTDSARIERVVVLQYNPDTLSRTLQVQGTGGESGDRVDVLRLKGAPVETIKLEAELDAADQLERPSEFPQAAEEGLHPALAALETCVYPTASSVRANLTLSATGTLEIVPPPAPLPLLVFGAARVLPVRIIELSVTEEAFTPELNPLRARVSLGLRVLGVNDVPRTHLAASLALAHHGRLERFAAEVSGRLDSLGIGGLP